MYENLKVERHGPVGWLINNRPERLNAMNNAMRDEFAEAWKEMDADPAVRTHPPTLATRLHGPPRRLAVTGETHVASGADARLRAESA